MNYDFTYNWKSKRFLLFNFLMYGMLIRSCLNMMALIQELNSPNDIYENPFDQFSFALAALIQYQN